MKQTSGTSNAETSWLDLFLSALNLLSLIAFLLLFISAIGLFISMVWEGNSMDAVGWSLFLIWLLYLGYIIQKTLDIQPGKKEDRWHLAAYWLGIFVLYFLSALYFVSQLPAGGGWTG